MTASPNKILHVDLINGSEILVSFSDGTNAIINVQQLRSLADCESHTSVPLAPSQELLHRD